MYESLVQGCSFAIISVSYVPGMSVCDCTLISFVKYCNHLLRSNNALVYRWGRSSAAKGTAPAGHHRNYCPGTLSIELGESGPDRLLHLCVEIPPALSVQKHANESEISTCKQTALTKSSATTQQCCESVYNSANTKLVNALLMESGQNTLTGGICATAPEKWSKRSLRSMVQRLLTPSRALSKEKHYLHILPHMLD